MKRKFATRYTATTTWGNKFWGTCPTWASTLVEQYPETKMRVERVLVVGGTRVPCYAHTEGHLDVSPPDDLEAEYQF